MLVVFIIHLTTHNMLNYNSVVLMGLRILFYSFAFEYTDNFT